MLAEQLVVKRLQLRADLAELLDLFVVTLDARDFTTLDVHGEHELASFERLEELDEGALRLGGFVI